MQHEDLASTGVAGERSRVLEVLRQLKEEWRGKGLLEMGVFGSFARGTAHAESDLDVYVRTETPNPYVLVHLKDAIEDRLHRRVDIVRLREGMNPLLAARIRRDGIDV